jgi:hypothetical protein
MQTKRSFVGSEVLTPVVIKSYIFWDITLCSPLQSPLTFRGNISPPSSGSKNKPSKTQNDEDGGDIFFRNVY